MAGIVFYGVDVHRAEIASLFSRIGDAGQWISTLSMEMKLLATAEAPKRSRELSRSHYTNFRRGTNQLVAHAEVENRARHAEWVHGGTTGPIYGNPWLYLPPWGVHESKVLRKVSGQAPNPWLERACAQVSRSRGAVRIL